MYVPVSRDDSSDRRVNRLHLTRKGERLHAAIWPVAEATVDDALGSLSPRQRRQLSQVMARVKAHLQALAEHDPVQAERAGRKGNGTDEARVR